MLNDIGLAGQNFTCVWHLKRTNVFDDIKRPVMLQMLQPYQSTVLSVLSIVLDSSAER